MLVGAMPLIAGISPIDLRCGSWQSPLGIDDPNPRLSWRVVATNPVERAQLQTAYQIQVASSAAVLAGNLGDLWDSGKVVSAQPFNVPYAGSALASAQQVFWRVKVWDKNDQPSAWSSVATWTMGLLNTNDWQGGWLVGSVDTQNLSLTGCNWIWYPEGNPASAAPVATRYFRKMITVRADSALTNAIFLLTADNSYTAYINGTQVATGSDYTVATPHAVTTQLSPGNNTLAISAANGGTSANPAGLLGKLVLRYADGQTTTVQLDATWKARNSLQSGWQNVGFNDSAWPNALVMGSYGISPWNSIVTVQTSTALPIFRREFAVRAGLQRALVYISGLGHYELSANGAKVGDALLAPGWTKYDKTCLYDTLDLTPILTNGNNALGVLLGNGMYNVPPNSRYTKFTGSFGPPKVIAQIHLFYADGTNEVISTDAQWKATAGPITFSGVFGGEDHDARLEPAGWNAAGFNASAWTAATVTTGPGGVLRGQSHAAPPLKAIETLQPIGTNVISSSTTVYDLGQNASIIARLTTHGEAGAVVRITPAELLNANGTVNRASAGGGASYWQYTLAGNGTEIWFPRFFYHGSRYLSVERIAAPGSSQLPVVDALEGVVVHTSSEPVGDFACSNELFNRVRTLIRWAQRNNLVSVITDCPHRERLGWLEQYHLHGPSLRYEYDLAQLYTKTMDDMADSQTAAGLIPDIAPEFTVFGGGFRDSPEWGSSFIIVPWQQYQFTGDDTLLRRYYSRMKQYQTYLQGRASNNMLNHGLGDWYDLGPGTLGQAQLTPVSLTATAYFFQNAQILADTARVIGQTNDAVQFDALAANIRTAFNNLLYSAGTGYYSTGSQTAQSIPLVLGLVNSNNQASVLAALVANVRSKGLTAGDIGHRYLLRALADLGRSDVIFDLHSKTNGPGYGYILNRGATALTEGWDGSSSQSHFMLGHIMEWFYHDLAGIQSDPAVPGFKQLIFKPAIVGGITWANASYESVRGSIASGWALNTNQMTLSVTVPIGSTAEVWLPLLGNVTTNLLVKEGGTNIWQNSAATGSVPGVVFARVEGPGAQTYQVWNVGSGSYQFAWNVFPSPTKLSAIGGNSQIGLSWTPVPGVTGYNLKRSLTAGGPYTLLAGGVTGTNYTDTSVVNGVAHYYVVTAVSNNLESVDSPEASATPGFVANLGFETPNIATYQYSPAGATWTFTAGSPSPSGAGITANGSAFSSANPPAPEGDQVGFVQGYGSISQTLSGFIPGGNYTLTIAGAQRAGQFQNAGESWEVRIDGNVIASFNPPANATNYVDYTAGFTATASTHTLALKGSNLATGDNTFFFDNVRLALVTSPVPPMLGWQVSGSQLQFSWPLDHIGWRLQIQTNALNFGLGTNWVTVPGSLLTNQFGFLMNAAAGSVFFRLIYP